LAGPGCARAARSRTRARGSVKTLAGGGEWVISRAVVPGPRGIGLGPFGQRAALCQRARGMARWKVARAGWFEAFAGLWFPEIGGSVLYFVSGGTTSRATRGIAITCR
jgi:hypothetical protein